MEQTVIEDIHTAPIVDETELLVFDPSQVADELKDRTPWFRKKDNGKKIIMCHDMKGGYKDDKYLNGTDNPYYYNFYNWAQIDIFIYFSHYLVTIPPTMWINSSHKNGIPVLGTFITEWEAGAKKCRNLFGTEESALYTAQKLADVAECYGFDGWLINIENTLDCCEVSNIKIFLQYLSSTLRDHNPNSYVIWYDAVTVEGKLVWQDSLNDMNYDYFESCHGIFLNYTWKDWHLELARNVSPDRLHDIYVGIDIWARGCVGKFDTYQSCEKIDCYQLSTALFAPGWVYETYEKDFGTFLVENDKFWELLRETCPPHPRPTKELQTAFNYGFGLRQFENGIPKELNPWFNMSKQDAPYVSFCKSDSLHIYIDYNDSCSSSTSVGIKSSNDDSETRLEHFICVDVDCDEDVVIELVSKDTLGKFSENFRLILITRDGDKTVVNSCQRSPVGGNGWFLNRFEVKLGANIQWLGWVTPLKNFIALVGKLTLSQQ